MITYKACNPDLTCRGYQYEIGKKHVHTGILKPCVSGFHSCPELRHVGDYYQIVEEPNTKLTRLFKVDVGDEWIECEDKIVSRELTLLEELPITTWDDIYHFWDIQFVNTNCTNTAADLVVATENELTITANRVVSLGDRCTITGNDIIAQDNNTIIFNLTDVCYDEEIRVRGGNNNTIIFENSCALFSYCPLIIGDNTTLRAFADKVLLEKGTYFVHKSTSDKIRLMSRDLTIIHTFQS